MLSNIDIQDIATKEINIKNFRGVFCSNTLPKQLIQGSFIINMETDMDDKGKINPGSHWIALYIDHHNQAVYFDSFGFEPNEYVKKYARKTGKKIAYSQKEIQDIKSECCGYYCLAFCKYMSSFNDPRLTSIDKYNNFLNFFNTDVTKNEHILKSMFE
jgi:hypothetical protein